MIFAEPPAVSTPHTAEDQADTIEVIGTRRDQAQKIDRRTYTVKDTPHAAQQDSLQLLRGLPAVTIGPNDQIMLLGSGSVTIQVDGQPVPYRNVAQFLSTLHGGDIERIEIITNPSAQYSASGAGGIINFILRRKQKDGMSGSANLDVRSIGFGQASATLKYKKGKWTYELQVQGAAGRSSRLRTGERRLVQAYSGAAPTIYTNDGEGSGYLNSFSVSGKITRLLSDATSISAQTIVGSFDSRSTSTDVFRGLTPDFASFEERQRSANAANYLVENLSFDHKGAKEGETLQASVRIFGDPTVHGRSNVTTDRGDGFSTTEDITELYTDAKIDWAHPIGDDRILSTGARWNFDDMHRSYRFVDEGGGLGADQVDRFQAQTSTLAGYVTYQQAIRSWKIMPGLRIERYGRSVRSPGHATIKVAQTDLFPTLHVEHPLGKALDLVLSYSKRIDRPDIEYLRPYRTITSIDTISLGNPHLRSAFTDAYEINLHYHRERLDIGAILYDRETSGLFSDLYSVDPEGREVITHINAGHKSDRGAEFDVSTPLWRRTKIMASVNLFSSQTPTSFGGRKISMFRYSTNTTLEWDGPDHRKRPGDVAQVQLNYQSAQRQFDTRVDSVNVIAVSYTHSITRTLSITASADSIMPVHIRTRTDAPLIEDWNESRNARSLRLKLLKRFGKN